MRTASVQHVAMGYLIDAHLEYLRAVGQAPRTIEARGRLLRQLHAYLPAGLAYAETDQLTAWLAQVAATCKPWTHVTYSNHLHAFYRWADGRYLEGDPSATIPPPRRPRLLPRPVTTEQVNLALTRLDPWWRRPILLAALAGLRVSEIVALDREDVTVAQLLIRRAKGGNPAAVPTHPQVWHLVERDPPGPVVRHHGARVTAVELMRLARLDFPPAGLAGVTMHRFRHWFGTELVRTGVHIRVVQELLRHASLASTQGYTLVTSAQREEGLGRLSV